MDHSIDIFHSEAAKRFDETSQEILQTVRALRKSKLHSRQTIDLHATITIKPEDILSHPRFLFQVDQFGDVVGVSWTSGDTQVGWIGESFQKIRHLASNMERTRPIQSLASEEFVLNEICEWLRETLEGKRSDALSEHVTKRCNEEIKLYEIWIPLFRSYSTDDLKIGEVRFRTISTSVMDEWWNRDTRRDSCQAGECRWLPSNTDKTARIIGGMCNGAGGEAKGR